jgi:two-component system response regulator GlrR
MISEKRKHKILLIDDDLDLLRLLPLRLRAGGYEVTTATSGEEG